MNTLDYIPRKKMKLLIFILISLSNIFCNFNVNRNIIPEYLPILSKLFYSSSLSIVYPSSTLQFTQNQEITTQTPTLNFSPKSCTSSISLPTGLTLDSTNCSLSGTPTYYFIPSDVTITASDGNNTASTIINLQVKPVQFTKLNGGPSGTLNSKGLTYSGNYYYLSLTTDVTVDGLSKIGTLDFIFSKFDLAGNRLWTINKGLSGLIVKPIGRHGIDSQGNLYVTGYTSGNLCGTGLVGTNDLFVFKISTEGSFIYCKSLGVAGGSIVAYNIVLDSSDNIYITGTSNAAFGGNTLTGLLDIFLVKLDSNGNHLWTKQFGAVNAQTYPYGINVDSSGNVYLAGHCWGSLFGYAEIGTYDAFVSKFDPSGNLLKSYSTGAAGVGTAFRDVVLDANGNVYTFGYTEGSINGNTLSGTNDALILKFDSSLNVLWTKQFGGGATRGYGGLIDSENNVYMTGHTTGSLPGHTLIGARDFWLVKYDSNGNLLNSAQLGNTSATIYSLYVVRNVFGQFLIAGIISGNGYDGNSLNGTVDYLITTKSSDIIK